MPDLRSLRLPAVPTTRQIVTLAHALVIAACCFWILRYLQPDLIFTNTTPSGGDMGAHVWGPAYLRDTLLPQGRISGWSMDWYEGFPFLQFYFPLPSLLIALLSFLIPYGIAFKVVTVLGLVTMPISAAALAILSGMRRPYAACLAIATVPYVFDRGWTIYGGNAASTLAGEFSFSIALSLSLLFLGVLARSLDTGRLRGVAAALFAATILCHILPALFAIVGAVAVSAIKGRLRGLLLGLTVGVMGLLIAGFWLFPFQQRLAYSNDMGWEKIRHYLLPLIGGSATSDQLTAIGQTNLDPEFLRVLFIAALIGAVVSIVLGRRIGIVLTCTAVVSALAFRFMPGHDSALPLAGKLWNARMLPFWYLSLYLLAACLAAEIAIGLIKLWHRFDPRTTPASVAAAEDAADAAERAMHANAALAGGLTSVDLSEVVYRLRARAADLRERARLARAIPQVVVPGLAAIIVLSWVSGAFGRSAFGPFNDQPRSYIDAWARWNYVGYEGNGVGPEKQGAKARRDEYFALVHLMDQIGKDRGCGRAFWEYEEELDAMGTPMALMLLPYWTDSCIGSSEGLYFESSATTPHHFLTAGSVSLRPSNPQRDLPYTPLDLSGVGITRMELLGIRYYMALSDQAKAQADADPRLEKIAETSSFSVRYDASKLPADDLDSARSGSVIKERAWAVYELRGGAVVAPLTTQPVVVEGIPKAEKEWKAMSARGWMSDPSRADVLLAANGPKEWARIGPPPAEKDAPPDDEWRRLGAEVELPRQEVEQPATVSNIRVASNRVVFNVDKPGSPVLVKVSYFPNWKAEGARGPYRVTPNLMVVIPTSTTVTMRYGYTPVDTIGWFMTLIGLVAALVLGRRTANLAPVLGTAGQWTLPTWLSWPPKRRAPGGGVGPIGDETTVEPDGGGDEEGEASDPVLVPAGGAPLGTEGQPETDEASQGAGDPPNDRGT